jgi:hypothetical protein
LAPSIANRIYPKVCPSKSLDLTTVELKKIKGGKHMPSGEIRVYLNCVMFQTIITETKCARSPNFIEFLPVDCLLKIVGFLPIHVRFKGMSVCKQWKDILSDRQFWTRIGMSLRTMSFFLSQ